MSRFTNPFTLQGIGQLLAKIEEKQARAYFVMAAGMTATGMILLGLFPLLTLLGVLNVLSGIAQASNFMAWLGVLLWIGITAIAGFVTLGMLMVKVHMPSGLGLKEDKSPKLHELIAEIGQSYKVPKIDHIIIHDYCELELLSVPRFGLPLLNKNVLYIGLPVLQSLSPLQFKGVLARKLGQFSAEHNRATHWIYRWRQYCAQYQRTYNRSKSPLVLPLRGFFRVYTPLLNAFTTLVARQDELEADVYALELMADTEMADVILRQSVSAEFLKTRFWPKVYALQRKNNPVYPHQSMAKVIREELTDNAFAQTMKNLMNNEPRWNDSMPDLLTRLENIGQTRLDIPPPVMETAAQRYLGEAYPAVVKLLDKQWLAKKPHKVASKTVASTSAEHAPTPTAQPSQKPEAKAPTTSSTTHTATPTAQQQPAAPLSIDEQRLAELKTQARDARLSLEEAYEMASLTEKLNGKALAISLYQKILKQDPRHARTLFAVGRILLAQNDPTAVKILETAMQIDKGVVAQGCWMLAKHFKSQGDDERSKVYLERAASVSAAA